MTTCAGCGAIFQKDKAKFCSKCGLRRQSAPTDGSMSASKNPMAASASHNPPPATKPTPPTPAPPAPAPRAPAAPPQAAAPSSAGSEEPASPPAPARRTLEPQDAPSQTQQSASGDTPSGSVDTAPSGPPTIPGPSSEASGPSAEPATPTSPPVRRAPYCKLFDCLEATKMLSFFGALERVGLHDDALPFAEDEDLATAGIDKPFERRRLLAQFASVARRPASSSTTTNSLPQRDPSTMSGSSRTSGVGEAVTDPGAQTLLPGDTGLSPELLETANADALRGYRKGQLLGRGTFGAVYMALLPSGRFAAAKVMEVAEVDQDGSGHGGLKPGDLIAISREIAMMRRIRHANVCEFLGCCYDKDQHALVLFMELVTGGTMTALVKKFKPIPVDVMKMWTRQLVVGLKYLHDNNVIHRDIKGENVLVDVNSGTPLDANIKLADFGAAKRLSDAVSHGKTVVGTPYWMAPEVVKSNDGYLNGADVWSLGCTVAEMVTGRPPWPTRNNVPAAILMIATSDSGPTEIPTEADGATPECIDFIKQCCTVDPEKRPTCADLLKHPWVAV